MDFGDLLSGEEQQSSVDVLLKLLDNENIDAKTDLTMSQIKTLVMAKWFRLIKTDKTAFECLEECLDYYKELKQSYKRQRTSEIIKGVTEMSQRLQNEQLIMKQQETMK